MKRYKHSLSHYKLQTFDMGDLVPLACYDVLPGDTIQQNTAALVRVSPLVAPVMHPVTVRIHHWFVPARLLWTGWEDFITGGPDGEGGTSGDYPVINTGAGAAVGSLLDYLGVPPSVASTEVAAMPVRAYSQIYNEFYRDQDLVSSRVVSLASGVDTTTDTSLAQIAWQKDYFTAARPWTQKGDDVTVPFSGTADVTFPVSTANAAHGYAISSEAWSGAAWVQRGYLEIQGDVANDPITLSAPDTGTQQMRLSVSSVVTWPTSGVTADLTDAASISVADFRNAFALQRYKEARAMYGSRYTEYLRYLGVRSSDARLQRPEYLGGGKQTIAFSEILQTGPDSSDDEGVGRLKGHGLAAMRSRRYRRFFEEHGYVITLMSVRPKTMYMDGLHRSWIRRTKEDYFQKELERIGQQEVQNQELYMTSTSTVNASTFGYQDRYAEYRHQPSQIAGEFRDTLNFWHMGRSFASLPVLNASFVTCDPTKRIHQVSTNHVLWVMANHSIQARRMVCQPGPGKII